jgi:carbonic anhydrase/acetyltransferase-like protein (isoleucine patch superfamily)
MRIGSIDLRGGPLCDFSRVGLGPNVRAGACVKQRAGFGERAVLDGLRADQVAALDAAPPGLA